MTSIASIRIATSKQDSVLLVNHGLTAKHLTDRIGSIIERAEELHQSTKSYKVTLEGHLQVTIPHERERGWLKCLYCDHMTPAPGKYEVKNLTTHEEVTFDHHTLHQMKTHHYFGIGNYYVNPPLLDRVISVFQFRHIKEEDVDSVLEIRKRNLLNAIDDNYPESLIHNMIQEVTREKFLGLSNDPARDILVATHHEKVIGTGSLYQDEIRLMCVDPTFQGQGIGKELLNRIENLARAKGLTALKLSASLPAESFYAHLGYARVDKEITERGPVISMTKALI